MDTTDLDRVVDKFAAQGVSRRKFLELAGMGTGALALGPLLAACGNTPGGGGTAASVSTLKAPSSNVQLAYWNPFSGPDGNLRGISCPEASILTFVPPISITRIFTEISSHEVGEPITFGQTLSGQLRWT